MGLKNCEKVQTEVNYFFLSAMLHKIYCFCWQMKTTNRILFCLLTWAPRTSLLILVKSLTIHKENE